MSKPATIILSGFALVILLVIALLAISLHQITISNNELENHIDVRSAHAGLANQLQNISNFRSALMLKILQTSDPFDRDDMVQKLYLSGQKFIQTRNKFITTSMNAHETKLLELQRLFSIDVVSIQHKIIDLRNNGDYQQAHHLFMGKALPMQQQNASYLNQLASYQGEQIKLITVKLTHQQTNTYRLVLTSGLTVILFCIFIAWFISKRLARNVTELQKTRDDLSKSLLEQQNLFYALNQHTIVSTTDTTGRISYVNEKFCEVSQYSEDELVGKMHNIVNSGFHKKHFFNEMWNTIANGITWQGEIRNKKKDGSYYWVESSIIPFLDKNNSPYQYIAIRTDITHIKEIEEDLEKSLEQLAAEAEKAQESNTLKDALISTMTHELRTPLNSILGFTQLLQLDDEVFNEIQIDNINNIHLAGKELLSKIEIIMLYSKLKSRTLELQYSDSELSLIFNSIINQFESDNITYNVYPKVINTNKLDITADILLFQKALSYIIDNAMKFTQHGYIHISYEEINKDSELPAHSTPAASDLILITIEDTGIGISEINMQMIFGEFRQVDEKDNRRFEGIGIGLSLARSIIEQHGGEIWLTSEIDKGTNVYITIPKTNNTDDEPVS